MANSKGAAEMCFGGGQPDNPVTKPSYSVEQMGSAIKQTKKDAATSTTDGGLVEQTPAPPKTVPDVPKRTGGMALPTM